MQRLVQRYGWLGYFLPVSLVAVVFLIINVNYNGHIGTSAATSPAGPAAVAPGPAAPGSSPAVAALNPCADNHDAQRILVDIPAQRAWMCAGDHEVDNTAVTTGDLRSGDSTPTGSWQIQAKQGDRTLTGPGYSDFVQYWMPYSGDFGFHDASWQTIPFGDAAYRTQGSHGCIRLPTAAMARLYAWARVGTTVTVNS